MRSQRNRPPGLLRLWSLNLALVDRLPNRQRSDLKIQRPPPHRQQLADAQARRRDQLDHRLVRFFDFAQELREVLAGDDHRRLTLGLLRELHAARRIGPTRLKLLSRSFTGRRTASGYQPAFGSKEAREAIQTFASYALMIYKEASALDEGLDSDSSTI